MLCSIKINNFALFEDIVIDFDKGFNIITGETGAGKSILINALCMVLGESTGKEIIRAGAESCEVEAVFFISKDKKGVLEYLKARELQEGDSLVLRRKFYSKGSSRCYINDHNVTLTTLKNLGNKIIDIHSQNKHQSLLNKNEQMLILDKYASAEHVCIEVKELWEKIGRLEKEKMSLLDEKKISDEEIERLKFEDKEISSIELEAETEKLIEKEFEILSNIETLITGAAGIYNNIYESEGSVIERIDAAEKEMEKLADIDSRLLDAKESINRAKYEIEVASETIRSYSDGIEFDQARLEEILEIRSKLQGLKRKYGHNIEDILKYAEEIKEKLSRNSDAENVINEIEEKIIEVKKIMAAKAELLSKKRISAAGRLSQEVTRNLNKLGMQEAAFTVKIIPVEMACCGKEKISFHINTNPGQPEMELAKIASGGEISRIMLSIKSVLAEYDSIPILVFDEIDAGIGATVAKYVGNAIRKLSGFHQVIAISHLPQIAGLADCHLKADKRVSEKKTVTRISRLCKDERINEIARMCEGKSSNLSRIQAEKLLSINKEG